ncbi:MAG: hypothetical protein NZ480_05765 [Bdellovibrionaceae bacterium]|nr:hypothetical protein [Pseudobdellovibrionaceae bacterium]MDW8190495.1 hypothetical protein [Pseudobdellovibrionaceae bacterium]
MNKLLLSFLLFYVRVLQKGVSNFIKVIKPISLLKLIRVIKVTQGAVNYSYLAIVVFVLMGCESNRPSSLQDRLPPQEIKKNVSAGRGNFFGAIEQRITWEVVFDVTIGTDGLSISSMV